MWILHTFSLFLSCPCAAILALGRVELIAQGQYKLSAVESVFLVNGIIAAPQQVVFPVLMKQVRTPQLNAKRIVQETFACCW